MATEDELMRDGSKSPPTVVNEIRYLILFHHSIRFDIRVELELQACLRAPKHHGGSSQEAV